MSKNVWDLVSMADHIAALGPRVVGPYEHIITHGKHSSHWERIPLVPPAQRPADDTECYWMEQIYQNGPMTAADCSLRVGGTTPRSASRQLNRMCQRGELVRLPTSPATYEIAGFEGRARPIG